jgi:hypothetical protein
MSKMRVTLVGLTAAGLIGVPAAALATSTGVFHQEASRHATSIRWLPFRHVHAAGGPMTLVGQIVSRAHGERGAVAGVDVKVYRKLSGTSTWRYLGTTTTDTGVLPRFRFVTPSAQNAHYKVAFAGTSSYAPSTKETWLTVYRLFHGRIIDGTASATYRGNVTPAYAHKGITLQKRSCATCSYVDYRQHVTGADGAFSFSLPAPPSGRWWWRVTVPGSTQFMPSYGGTISTQYH